MNTNKLIAAALLAAAASTLPVLAAAKKPAAKPAAKKPAAKPSTKPTPVPANMMPAPFATPQAAFLGTPKVIKDTTAPKHVDRTTVYIPKGSVNLSAGKPVTGSDDAPIIGDLKMITDGDKEAKEGSWVELAPSTQWVQIDLKKKADICGVLTWHYHGESRVYRDVVVQLADDADFITNVRTVYNNDQDNSSGLGLGKQKEYYEHRQGHWIPISGQKAQFVRLYSRGNTSDPQNQYIEVEVWGK